MAGLTMLLAGAMVVAIFGRVTYGVLAPILVEEMGLSRTQVGTLASAYALTGAVLSLPAGHVIDRIGGRRSLLLLFGLSGLGLVAIALGVNYLLLLGASVVAGCTQAVANPGTNRVIAEYVPPGSRGLPTGVKQSGVQLGIVVAGLVLPWGAASLGWRPTLVVIAAIAWLLGLAAVPLVPDSHHHVVLSAPAPQRGSSADTAWLVFFGLSTGAIGGAVLTYLPLFAEERVGLSVAGAGAAASVMGGFGIVGRIASGHFSERLSHVGHALVLLGVGSALAATLVWSAETLGSLPLWIGAGLAGLTIMSWMSVLMLATMATSGLEDTGRVSGMVVLGFLLGHAIGPPLFGYMVDLTGRYTSSMAGLVALSLVTAGVAWAWIRRRGEIA